MASTSASAGGSSSASPQTVKVGQYHLLQTLGTGSFGKVKLAVHSLTGHKVAMKIINRKKIVNMDMTPRVKREIQYLKVLRHPHIIKLYEVITTPTDIIMVIEYAGGELFNYIVEKGKMPEDEARRFFQQIICAIEYCHRHKIVHRDLKPENLLLDDQLNVKIGDFGLSNIMQDGDFLKTSCGSPNYAAPEVISGKLYAGPEIDIWSCGVILYVMLCGRLPFDDDYIPTLFKKINGGIYHLPSWLSPDAKYLLSQMLIVDPVKRITISEIRQLPWFQTNLPRYLQPMPFTPSNENGPPMGDLASLIASDDPLNHVNLSKRRGSDDSEAPSINPEREASKRGWVYTYDLGVIDPKLVHELQGKMTGWQTEDIWEALKKEGDNQVKVAFQLIRDHRRMLHEAGEIEEDEETQAMESFLAQSPPAWNDSGPPLLDGEAHSDEETDDDDDEDDIPNSNFALLDSSLPGYAEDGEDATSIHLSSYAAAQNAAMSVVAPGAKAKNHKPRWHFGIRSRSPPMEVMLEIYRTLQSLGMEWRKKTPPPDNNIVDEKGRKDHSAEEKYAQGLFFVETRCRIRDVVVRMDLQLYKVDAQNMLVDFRNVGYYKTIPGQPGYARLKAPSLSTSPKSMSSPSSIRRSLDGHTLVVNPAGPSLEDVVMRSEDSTVISTPSAPPGGAEKSKSSSEMEVTSPFLFLDCACRLIVELAGG